MGWSDYVDIQILTCESEIRRAEIVKSLNKSWEQTMQANQCKPERFECGHKYEERYMVAIATLENAIQKKAFCHCHKCFVAFEKIGSNWDIFMVGPKHWAVTEDRNPKRDKRREAALKAAETRQELYGSAGPVRYLSLHDCFVASQSMMAGYCP